MGFGFISNSPLFVFCLSIFVRVVLKAGAVTNDVCLYVGLKRKKTKQNNNKKIVVELTKKKKKKKKKSVKKNYIYI